MDLILLSLKEFHLLLVKNVQIVDWSHNFKSTVELVDSVYCLIDDVDVVWHRGRRVCELMETENFV